MADWPDGIDMDQLTAPISEEAPAGADLREDFSAQSAYYRLRDARSEARAAERAADANPGDESPPPQQWRTVRDLSLQALGGKTKDLEVAAWLTESLVRSEGVRGLAAGAHLIRELAERYWDSNLFPMPDEDGIVTRVAPVTGLNGEGGEGTLIQPLRKLPMFPRPDGGTTAYWQYEQSAALKTITDPARLKTRLAAGVMPFDQMETEARAAGGARFATLRREIKAAQRAWQAMGELLDAKAGPDSPPTSQVRDLLADILTAVQRYAPPETPEELGEVTAEEGAEGEAEAGEAGEGGGAVRSGPLRPAVNREDMLRELARISDYFRKTEPQSPIAYTLEEAVRRGRLTWPELLAEVLTDAKARDNVLIQLGIRPLPPEPKAE